MRFVLCLLLVSFVHCSILGETDEKFDLIPSNLEGEWTRVKFNDTFTIHKLIDSAELPTNQHIRYSFTANSFNSCKIYNSVRPDNFYGYCRWNIYGEYPEIYLSIEYRTSNNPNGEIQSFLYQVVDKSSDQITLRTIRQAL